MSAPRHQRLCEVPAEGGRRARRVCLRGAITLIEVVLTLALLVLLAAMSWPAMSRPLAGQRLRSGAEQVQAEWVRTRVKAMSSGQTYVFRYTAGANGYSVERFSPGELTLEATAGDWSASQASGEQSTPAPLERSLPEGVTFLAGRSDLDVDAAAALSGSMASPDQQQAVTPFALPESDGAVFFYPDGTTSTAKVVLRNEYGRTIEIMLRGVTGTATVGQISSVEEAPVP